MVFMSEPKIYVGNLSYGTTEDKLTAFFGQFGTIKETRLIKDRATGDSKGFGFITYESADEANQAVEKANDVELDGRKMKVSIAKSDNAKRSSGGGFRSGGGGFDRRNNGGGFDDNRRGGNSDRRGNGGGWRG